LPLKSITFADPRAAKVDTNDTPAELPSGRVRFSDELGRETALVARREQQAASRAAAKRTESTPVAAEPAAEPTVDAIVAAAADPAARASIDDEAAAPSTIPTPTMQRGAMTPAAATPSKPKAPRSVAEDDAKGADPASEGDEEIALALAQFGLAVPARLEPVPPPPTTLDPLGTRVAGEGTRTVAAEDGATTASGEEFGAMALVGERAADGAAARMLVARFEKNGEHDATTSVKVAAADTRHADADLARLVAASGAAHVAEAAAPATVHGSATPAAKAAAEQGPAAARVADLLPRVALSEIPRALSALQDELGPQMRMGRRGRNWEVEMRLDPPELGSLHIRFELRGDAIRGVVHCDPRVERLLAPVLKELEDQLNQQGGGASFDLSRQAKEGEPRPSAPRAAIPDPVPAAAAGLRASSRRIGPSRLIDVTA